MVIIIPELQLKKKKKKTNHNVLGALTIVYLEVQIISTKFIY